MADQNKPKKEQYSDENEIGALGNQDQTSTKANQNQIADQYLYSTTADQNLSENQDDQDLADDPDYVEVDEDDDQYDIQGGEGLYGTGDYGHQGGPEKPGSARSRYGTKMSQDQNGNQQ